MWAGVPGVRSDETVSRLSDAARAGGGRYTDAFAATYIKDMVAERLEWTLRTSASGGANAPKVRRAKSRLET
jgi:hypothetical protein